MATLYVRIPDNIDALVKEAAWAARMSAAKYVRAMLTRSFAEALNPAPTPKRKPRKRLSSKRVRK
jgi:hypothetical protein